jgi:3',5'-cyclic AMP phosphodiesterase CpdA
VGAGDIGVCGIAGASLTASLLDTIDGVVFTTGDHAYSNGALQDFFDCYDPFWGRHKGRTRPSPGNHDYQTPGAADYFSYFGANAGPAGRGYYSFTAGSWRVLSLNSNVPAGPGSAQLAWLRDQLTQEPAFCVAAYWHHPLVSSGRHGNNGHMRDVWRLLMEHKAELVVTGHDHTYERFAAIDENGFPSPSGVRAFVAGSGGAPLYEFASIQPGSEVRIASWGVLKLTLRSDSYDWEFVPAAGGSGRDLGAGGCR